MSRPIVTVVGSFAVGMTLCRRAEAVIAGSDVVLSVLEIPLEGAAEAMALGRKHGVKTILNPAPAAPLREEFLRVIDLITPNETELRILMRLAPDDAASTRELARELQKKFGITVIVTRGESGMMLVDDQGLSEFASVHVDVVDTTGAGDAFTAALAVSLAEGRDLTSAIKFAGCHGALACTKYGVIPSLATRPEVDRLFSIHSPSLREPNEVACRTVKILSKIGHRTQILLLIKCLSYVKSRIYGLYETTQVPTHLGNLKLSWTPFIQQGLMA